MQKPAYSKGTSKRSSQFKEQGGASRSFNVERKLSVQAPISRPKQGSTTSTNPGLHNPKKPQQSSPRALVLSKGRAKAKENTPGPGSYSPGSVKNSISFTFSSSRDTGILKENIVQKLNSGKSHRETAHFEPSPGPGSYNIASVMRNAPRAVFTKTPRSKHSHMIVPGPGDYNTENSSFGISHRFGKAHKSKSRTEKSPGPGSYELNHSTNKGHAARIVGRRKTAENIKTPGPGAYNPDIGAKQSPRWSIPRTGRLSMKNNVQASPASYYPVAIMARSSSCPFNRAERFVSDVSEKPERTKRIARRIEKNAPTTIASSDTLVEIPQVFNTFH